ncbi:MAG: ribbon-helix-helix protein, CopG family [Clostridia bacterium]|nr:ribbon-helix-helix protein, CopG family [Clostridia bacterium]
MSQLKKVLITVPDSLLEAVDSAAKVENINRSEFVREAMKMYLSERRKHTRKEQLKKGYQQMAELNLSLAEVYFDAEEEAFSSYEEKLAECE